MFVNVTFKYNGKRAEKYAKISVIFVYSLIPLYRNAYYLVVLINQICSGMRNLPRENLTDINRKKKQSFSGKFISKEIDNRA